MPDIVQGKRVCITGSVIGMTRDEIFLDIEERGGHVDKTVDRYTTLLVIGNKPGATKLNAARRWGIPSVKASLVFVPKELRDQMYGQVEAVPTVTTNDMLSGLRELLGMEI
jgi:hypothetical protein